jgi:cellulose synthase/poly-beta-1,6-N-acetylglucosamine synthase-like glycosyltransferase
MSGAAIFGSAVFWLGFVWLGWVYAGYSRALRLWPKREAERFEPAEDDLPSVTVLVTVHDGAAVIEERLADLMRSDYPSDRFEIVVASDGSSDATMAIVEARRAAGLPLRGLDLPRAGKSPTQNLALAEIASEVVVFTDGDCTFDPACVRRLAAPFTDPSVGCTTAHLEMREGRTAIAAGQSAYWRRELDMRDAESRLGILAVASGPAMAVRRSLFRPLPANVGEDCIVPLDVVAAGHRVVHVASAHALDTMNHDLGRELRARIRMTNRNWIGTWRHPELLTPWHRPGIALALWSHKLGRWAGGPVLVAMLLAGLAALLAGRTWAPEALFLVAVLGLGAIGAAGEALGRRLPIAGTVYGFLAANLGFTIGLFLAARGRRIVTYRPAIGGG